MRGISVRSMISGMLRFMRTLNAGDVPVSMSSVEATSSDSPLDIRELIGAPPSDNYEQFGPVMQCLCGSDLFIAILSFDERDRTVGQYFTNGRCAVCHADVTLPTEIDSLV